MPRIFKQALTEQDLVEIWPPWRRDASVTDCNLLYAVGKCSIQGR